MQNSFLHWEISVLCLCSVCGIMSLFACCSLVVFYLGFIFCYYFKLYTCVSGWMWWRCVLGHGEKWIQMPLSSLWCLSAQKKLTFVDQAASSFIHTPFIQEDSCKLVLQTNTASTVLHPETHPPTEVLIALVSKPEPSATPPRALPPFPDCGLQTHFSFV